MSRPGHRYARGINAFGAVDAARDCEYDVHCDQRAVYAPPWPGSDGQPTYCCPYHLALYEQDWPDQYGRCRDHASLEDPDQYKATDRFVDLAEAPPKIWSGTHRRIGVDGQGFGHYVRLDDDAGQVYIVLVDDSLAPQHAYEFDVEEMQLGPWIRSVRQDRGWTALDEAWLEQCPRGDHDA